MTKTAFRAALKQLGLNQRQASEAMKMSQRTIQEYAGGRMKVPFLVEYWIKDQLEKQSKTAGK